MLQVSSDLVERSAAIIGADGVSDEQIESDVLALAKDPMLARRLIDWIPEVFGLVFAPHLAKVTLPTTFSAKSSNGEWVDIELQLEPIVPIAARLGVDMYHAGPNTIFRNIVLRSALIDTVNAALNQGAALDGATLSGPAFIGIPAETYLPRRPSLWRRLFR